MHTVKPYEHTEIKTQQQKHTRINWQTYQIMNDCHAWRMRESVSRRPLSWMQWCYSITKSEALKHSAQRTPVHVSLHATHSPSNQNHFYSPAYSNVALKSKIIFIVNMLFLIKYLHRYSSSKLWQHIIHNTVN